MEREIVFYEAWDRRDSDPKKNYGIGGVDIAFYLKGDKGAVQFKLFTGWVLPEVLGLSGDTHNTLYNYDRLLHSQLSANCYPSPVDLGYHSLEPMYEDQQPLDCHLLEGGKCYYDGSSLNAYNAFAVLLRKGSEGVFEYLENYYKELFDEPRG